MTKSILWLVFLFLLSGSQCLAKELQSDTKVQVAQIANQVKHFQDSLTFLKTEIHNIQTEKRQRTEKDTQLQKSIQTAYGLIDSENIIVNAHVYMIGLITLLIALLSIFGYFYQIKPIIKDARDAVNRAETSNDKAEGKIEKLEKKFDELHSDGKALMSKIENDSKTLIKNVQENLDEKIQESFNKNKQQQIDQAIINITSNEKEFKDYALSVLRSIQPHEFNETQLFKILGLLKSDTTEDTIKSILLEIMAKSKNAFSEDFFTTVPIISADWSIRRTAIMYFKDNEIQNYLVTISKMILGSQNPSGIYILISGWLSSGFKDKIIPIINCEELHDKLKVDQAKLVLDYLLDGVFREIEDKIKESILFKKVNRES